MGASEAPTTRRLLESVRSGPLLAALGRLEGVAAAERTDDRDVAVRLLAEAVDDRSDTLTATVAVHALAGLGGREAEAALTALLEGDEPSLREHAAWALGTVHAVPRALPGLTTLVGTGGFPGALAQRTLETWAAKEPDLVRAGIVGSLTRDLDDGPRSRLVETLGLVPGDGSQQLLRAMAGDRREGPRTRAAAVTALGDGASPTDGAVRATLTAVVTEAGPLAEVARLALSDLDARVTSRPGGRHPGPEGGRPGGLTVGQLFLHADIDGSLRYAGQADTGGIATLLVQLGDALVAGPGPVERVLTVSGGHPGDAGDAADPGTADGPGHHYLPVPLWGPRPEASDAWPLRVPVRRAMRRILARGGVDVLHLRMADVASWAGAEAARELGVPVVMTVAPDPHALVVAREADGSLTRPGFAAADRVEHLAFRVALLRALQEQAAHVVVFPRPALVDDLRDLLGIDLEAQRERTSVVAEGIGLAPLDRAAQDVRATSRATLSSAAAGEALDALDVLLSTLPPERRHLPLAVSVGRLHRVKGMATLVSAWATHPELSSRCNLLVVGGDLDAPSADEREQLDRIDAAVPPDVRSQQGLLLAGHRPNPVVALWLAAVRVGRPGLCAPGGVYVSASLKEEFGIAILEAMGSGLVVVAPRGGGPATYVEDGVTGVLVDTSSPAALAGAAVTALDLAARPDADARAAMARRLVGDRFSIEAMASALVSVYAKVVA